jgi:hypothetical protein
LGTALLEPGHTHRQGLQTKVQQRHDVRGLTTHTRNVSWQDNIMSILSPENGREKLNWRRETERQTDRE